MDTAGKETKRSHRRSRRKRERTVAASLTKSEAKPTIVVALPLVLLARVVSFLSVQDHLCSAARVCKQLRSACKNVHSWATLVDFSRFPLLPSLDWLDRWSCRPRHVWLSLGCRCQDDREVPESFLCAVGRRATRIHLVEFKPFRAGDMLIARPGTWQAWEFPRLQELAIGASNPLSAALFDSKRAMLPLLKRLLLTGGSASFQRDPQRLPSLQSLYLWPDNQQALIDPSLFPVLRHYRLQFLTAPRSGGPTHWEMLAQLTKCTRLKALSMDLKLQSAFECNLLLAAAADAKLPVTAVCHVVILIC